MDKFHLEEKIKIYIKRAKTTQKAVAEKLGYKPDSFNKLVKGTNNFNYQTLLDLAEILALSEAERDELLTRVISGIFNVLKGKNTTIGHNLKVP